MQAQANPTFPTANEQSQQREHIRSIQKNVFDHGKAYRGTFKFGQLIPFFIKEVMPNDDVSLDVQAKLRFNRMPKPTMENWQLKIWYFYVTYNSLWKGSENSWQNFITKLDLSDPDQNELHPYIELGRQATLADNSQQDTLGGIGTDGNSQWPHPIHEHMGFPTPVADQAVDPTYIEQVNAFPFATYWKIINEYFLNPRLEDMQEIFVSSGNNTRQSWMQRSDLLANVEPWYRMSSLDYFTSATYLPYSGLTDVLIPMVSPNVKTSDDLAVAGPYQWRSATTGATVAAGRNLHHSSPHEIGGGTGTFQTSDYTGGAPGGGAFLDVQATAASIRDLRFAEQSLEFLERLNRTGNKYRDVMRGFYGVDPLDGVIDYAEFIGSTSAFVQITDVLATADTVFELQGNQETARLTGDYSGRANVQAGGGGMRIHCPEHGLIMGIVNVQAPKRYMNGMHKLWKREFRFDYAWPEFAAIGDQPIYNYEIKYNPRFDIADGGTVDNYSEWGYQPRYQEWRQSMAGTVAGELRNEWVQWHTAIPSNSLSAPQLGNIWAQADEQYLNNFTKVQGTHDVFAWIYTFCKIARVLPKYGIPAS